MVVKPSSGREKTAGRLQTGTSLGAVQATDGRPARSNTRQPSTPPRCQPEPYPCEQGFPSPIPRESRIFTLWILAGRAIAAAFAASTPLLTSECLDTDVKRTYTADRCPPKITPVTDPPVAGYYVAVFRHGSWLHPGSGKADHRALIRVLIGELNPVARNLPQIPVFLLPLAKRISCYEGNVAAVRLPIADGSRAS